MSNLSFRYFELCGFPVKLAGRLRASQWRALLGRADGAPTQRPVLTLRWVEGEAALDKLAARPGALDVLRGKGFVLDYARRTAYLPSPFSEDETPAAWRQARESFCRVGAFALSLLGMGRGPATVARASSGRQVLVPLHASAVATPRGALLFCGRSHFGKTTIAAKLLAAYPLIEFDLAQVLVGPLAGRRKPAPPRLLYIERFLKRAFGPSHGRKTDAWALPVRGLFWLKKSARFALQPMQKAHAAALLLSPPLGPPQPESPARRLRALRALLDHTPCQGLEFRKQRAPLVRFLKKYGYL